MIATLGFQVLGDFWITFFLDIHSKILKELQRQWFSHTISIPRLIYCEGPAWRYFANDILLYTSILALLPNFVLLFFFIALWFLLSKLNFIFYFLNGSIFTAAILISALLFLLDFWSLSSFRVLELGCSIMFGTVTLLQALLVYKNQSYTAVMMSSLKDPWKLLYFFFTAVI